MKPTLLIRSKTVALAAVALSLCSPNAWATAPTSLEVGPAETILNAAAISSLGSNIDNGDFTDESWQISYDGTTGSYFYDFEDDSPNANYISGIGRMIGTLDNPMGTGGISSEILIGNSLSANGTYVLTDDTITDTNSYRYAKMKVPTDLATPPIDGDTVYGCYVMPGPHYVLTDGSGVTLGFYGVQQEMYGGLSGCFYGFNGMAKSTNGGIYWQDLGEVLSPPETYNPATSGVANRAFPETPGPVVVDPSGSYLYWYTDETTGSTHARNRLLVSRASIANVISASTSGTTTPWFNYTGAGEWTAPADISNGIGESAQLIPGNSAADSNPTILWNQYLKKYILLANWYDGGLAQIQFSVSSEGTDWTAPYTVMAPDRGGSAYPLAVGVEQSLPYSPTSSAVGGPTWSANGEFHVQAESYNHYFNSASTPYVSYFTRRKVWILDNFDNDTPGMSPTETGWQAIGGWASGTVEASPTSGTYTDHPNSLQIDAASGITGLGKEFIVNGAIKPVTSMDFHAEVYPTTTFASGLTIQLKDGGVSSSTIVFEVSVGSSSISYYNGSSSSWVSLGSIPNPEGAWHQLDINATNTSYATVSWDHVVLGTIQVRTAGSDIDSVVIYSAAGSEFYVDNVFLYPSEPTDTFENNTTSPAMLPNGYFQYSGTTTSATTLVSTGEHYTGGYTNASGSGSQSMEIQTTGGDQAFAGRNVNPTSSKWVEAQVYPASLGTNSPFMIYMMVPGTHVFTIALVPPNSTDFGTSYTDYTLKYYNSSSVWTLLADLGSSGILNAWHQIDVDASSTTSAPVYWGGALEGTATNNGVSSTINQVAFGVNSGGTAGSTVYVDNVYISPFLTDDNDFVFDPTGTAAPFGYTVVAGSGSEVKSTVGAYSPDSGTGGNSYYVGDSTTGAMVERVVTAEPGKSIDLEVYPNVSSGGAIYIDLASGGTSTADDVFRLGIFSGGVVKYENPSSGWTTLTGFTANMNAWNELTIVDPDPTSTAETKNWVVLSTASTFTQTSKLPNWHSATTIDRAVFSCATTSDDFYVDDVFIQ